MLWALSLSAVRIRPVALVAYKRRANVMAESEIREKGVRNRPWQPESLRAGQTAEFASPAGSGQAANDANFSPAELAADR